MLYFDQAFSQDLKSGSPIGGPEEHARCFSAVMSAKVSKDFQICQKTLCIQ